MAAALCGQDLSIKYRTFLAADDPLPTQALRVAAAGASVFRLHIYPWHALTKAGGGDGLAARCIGGWCMNSNSTPRAANFWWNTGAWKLRAAGR
jgi:hypothetical protein